MKNSTHETKRKTKRTIIALLTLSAALAGTASAEVVVIVSAKNAKSAMTKDEVADVYLGKDNSLAPIDLPESSELRNEFYTKVTGKDASQVKAVWARLIFTGKATPPKAGDSPADVKSKVAASDKAIGYVDKSAVDASVKVVLTVN
jgi:ABC-type phosphate transport system substrate-binding protein